MTSAITFQAVSPIGESDPNDLPVRNLAAAVSYYEQQLGFTVVSKEDAPHRAATIRRDAVVLRLAENGGEPEQASCYVAVRDVEGLHQELAAQRLDVSAIRLDQYGGQTYRVFFLRAPDGLCYCLGQKQA